MAIVSPTPDAELLRRLKARERGAWEELYGAYQPRLRAFAYRLAGNVHDADDLVQETFVRAVPRLDRLDPEKTEVSAYLFTTLRNLFLKQVERQKRQQPVADVPEPSLPTAIEDDPERRALLVRQQEEVRVANAGLQPRQRMVLALRELEDRSYAEIGVLVGMKENAVAQLIFRARESLRTELRLAQVDPERLPEECRRFLPLLAAHLDGQLKGPRVDETLAHLEDCERCQSALADMQEASRRYRTILLPLLASDDARAAVEKRLHEAGYWTGPVGRFARRSTQIALAAIIALLLSGTGTAIGLTVIQKDSKRVAITAAEIGTRTAPTNVSTTTAETSTTTPTKTEPFATTQTVAQAKGAKKPKARALTTPKTTVTTDRRRTRRRRPAPTTTPPKVAPPALPRDKTPPTVKITGAPATTISVDAADISFTASESGVTFACKVDVAAYASCTSPIRLTQLAAGSHTFSVQATDRAGNTGAPATVTWTYTPPDRTPPTVKLDSTPPSSTTDTAARFTFSASEPSTYGCSLDGAAFTDCTSPTSYGSLAPGSHTFAVRGTDSAGNTGAPVTYSWTIVELLPDLYVNAFTKYSITVSNRGNATAGSSVLTITNVGTFTIRTLSPGASVTLSWSTCRVAIYTAVVDRGNDVRESNETNNTATLRNSCP
jgi:RNA polymerase sigma factor (sigma-70 family)